MVYQLLQGVSVKEMEKWGLSSHYAEHGHALFPTDANGIPFTCAYIAATSDPIADLHENLAAEQKARATYDHLIKLTDDPDIKEPLKFLREREVVHFQRFGEALDHIQFHQDCKKYH